MKKYTILGIWDNGQVWVESAQGADAYEAMRNACNKIVDADELSIIGAVEGDHKLITPGDDNGSAAYAVDLAGGEDD